MLILFVLVLDQIKISLTTYESTSSPATTHLQSNQKPVSHNNKDRQHTTHTKNKNSEREQHTVSCSSTAFASESVGNDRSTTKTLFGFQENCEKLLLDSASNILIETCSCNTAKRGSPIRTKTGEDQGRFMKKKKRSFSRSHDEFYQRVK